MVEPTSEDVLKCIKRRELKVCLFDNDIRLPIGSVWNIPVSFDKDTSMWHCAIEKYNLNKLTLRLD